MRITPNPADTTFLRELRDKFAAAALEGLLAGRAIDYALRDKFAQEAYHYADQMMEARKRSP